MTNTHFHEDQFFTALRDIFVGAEIEGESGFINLMRIKSRYYTEGVFPHLKKDIDAALEPFPQFREELFDKLFTFFERYFSESGSIYFRYTPLHQNIYEKVYTDDRDVVLFWKTHMLYYVKTDRIFNSLKVEVDSVNFYFDASQIEHKRANEKRDVVFTFREVAPDGALIFDTAYSERGRITKIDDILKDLRKADITLSDETLGKAFRVFEKQSEVDFFINKNARAFLEEQFDLWMYQYLFKDQADIWSAERLAQLQTLKGIAYKVIAFISQFEDELVKIWNKPKFVRNSHYIITLDHFLQPGREDLLKKLFQHPGMEQQIKEWVEFGILEKYYEPRALLEKLDLHHQSNNFQFLESIFLPIDTSFFSDIEPFIIKTFNNLDENIDGWVIHSENFQALNTFTRKYKGEVDAVYIDPPYNSDLSEIIYANNYKDSSWLSILDDRLLLTQSIMVNDSKIGIAIDDFEFPNLAKLVENYFRVLGKIVVRSNPAGRSSSKGFSLNHEYIVFASKSLDSTMGYLDRSKRQIERYSEKDSKGRFEWVNFRKHGGLRAESPQMFYPIYISNNKEVRIPKMTWNDSLKAWETADEARENEIIILPIDTNGQERRWKWSLTRFTDEIDEVKVDTDQDGKLAIYIRSRMPDYGVVPGTWWDKKEYSATDWGAKILKELFGKHGTFSYPKAPKLVEDCLKVMNVHDNSLVLDFYAGSGTTAHAVMNLNREDGGSRKYILVEMGEHFHDVILPRIKKVAFNSKWKDGKPLFEEGESGISQFVKYYDLEQYEETLQKTHYEDADLFNDPDQDPYHSYVFLRDRKLLDAVELDQENDKVIFHPERLYPDIDLAETLSHLRGKWIKRITEDFVEFEDGEQMSLKEPDWETLKPMVWWR
ncbi:MAG: site-specific DNA-methyltransferase [Anaerolineaceae bacterium]|nr:site-specific DNA-methyltransferase [Anaerolineaceae bacterium]